ncbi:ATP-binding protein [Rhodococcus ruber]|uniref:ATP-binding protein n=1 Tax=Rhodococcus ruber TaxID=1830 RepID=UPI001F205852|nr:ATP-binding protein [Rhodococcus ruber]MCF8785250.1 ATP-binding protein [Rhodococcus ruber]
MTQYVALYGPRGAGKSTSARLILDIVGAEQVMMVHSAAPIYELQSHFYRIAGIKKDYRAQDGNLLSDIARHLRRLDPDCIPKLLLATIAEQFDTGTRPKLVVCDDSTPDDRRVLESAGFVFIHVTAPGSDRFMRRAARGDISAVNDLNDPNITRVSGSDMVIDNADSLAMLRSRVAGVLHEIGVA